MLARLALALAEFSSGEWERVHPRGQQDIGEDASRHEQRRSAAKADRLGSLCNIVKLCNPPLMGSPLMLRAVQATTAAALRTSRVRSPTEESLLRHRR